MIDCFIVLATSVGFLSYCVWRHEEALRAHAAQLAALDSLERSMMERIAREVNDIERRQAVREEARLRLLVESAGQVGSVKGVTELLTGLLAQMSAKLDRQAALPVTAS